MIITKKMISAVEENQTSSTVRHNAPKRPRP
jgi:hypothetical protein